MSENHSDRRKFLAAAAAGAGFVAIAPGIRLVEIAAAKPENEREIGEIPMPVCPLPAA